jgi:uncharacterized protein YndB with AHSA1/START domain
MPDILHHFFVKAPAQKVFDAFARPEGLNSWWPKESAGKPEPREAYRFNFGPEYDWHAKVLQVTPGKSLSWQMTVASEDWQPTSLGFELTEVSGGTEVFFYHRNWQKANKHFSISNYCWGQLLNGLKNYVEKAEVVPFEQRN